MGKPRITFAASAHPQAQERLEVLTSRYASVQAADAGIVVALGGDGFMLEMLHTHLERSLPIYGMNCGSVGFLMNEYKEDGLLERLARAERAEISPLKMNGADIAGRAFEALAINDVSLLRETRQTAKIRISVDGKVRLAELIADGALVATPAGSTAYNLSAHGPILPIDAKILALTPISAFRPRRWRGALLPHMSHVRFDILEPKRRPVSVTADNQEFRDVAWVEVCEASKIRLAMMFDEGRALDERILIEQFES